VVVAVGEPAHGIAEGAVATPGWPGKAVRTAGRDAAVAWVRENVAAEDVVLVKASRGAALEKIADVLLEEEGRTP
jgi:UDP-N-acetylmuramoyl-tripeptide--D-alanyl-D-alanine ligase